MRDILPRIVREWNSVSHMKQRNFTALRPETFAAFAPPPASLRLGETGLTAKALSSREGRKVMFAVGSKNNSFAGGGRAA
jgi:hypothetical protein